PSRSIRYEIKTAIGRPFWLKNGFVRRAGDFPAVGNRSIFVQRAYPQFGPVPRHLRMSPTGPGQVVAVSTDARERVEVIAGHDDFRITGSICSNGNEFVNGFGSLLVTFPNAYDDLSVRRNATIGIAQAGWRCRFRCDCQWLSVRFLSVKSLILE